MNRRRILAALPVVAFGAAAFSATAPASAQTPAQIENLARHFFKKNLDALASDGEASVSGSLRVWNGSTAQQDRFRGYATVIAQMFPDCIAPYLDTAPF